MLTWVCFYGKAETWCLQICFLIVAKPGVVPNVSVESCQAMDAEDYVKFNNCTSSQKIKMKKCSGLCESSYDPFTDTSVCTCCRPKVFLHRRFTLDCPDQSRIFKVLKVIESCECQTKW